MMQYVPRALLRAYHFSRKAFICGDTHNVKSSKIPVDDAAAECAVVAK